MEQEKKKMWQEIMEANKKWLYIYYAEMDRLDKEYPGHGTGGWSILWEAGLIKTINDFVEMLVCFYGEYAIQYTYDVQNGSPCWDEYEFGYTFEEVRRMLKKYYEEVE